MKTQIFLFNLEIEAALIKQSHETAREIYRKIVNVPGQDTPEMRADYSHIMEQVHARSEILKNDIEIYKLQQVEKKEKKFLGLF